MERSRNLPKVKSQLLRGEARTLVHKDNHPRAAEQGTLSLQGGRALAGGWLGRGLAEQEAGVTHRKPSSEWTDAEYWFKNSRTSFNAQWSERQGSTNCGPKGTSGTGTAQTGQGGDEWTVGRTAHLLHQVHKQISDVLVVGQLGSHIHQPPGQVLWGRGPGSSAFCPRG